MRKLYLYSSLILSIFTIILSTPVLAETSGETLDSTSVSYLEIDTTSDIVTQCMGVFKDVDEANKFCPYIEFLFHQKVINGNTEGQYLPGENLTRGALTKYVVNAFNIPVKLSGEKFPDVEEDNSFYSFIMALKDADLVSGYSDGEFKPENFVTRAELTKILVNVAEYKQPDLFSSICVCEKITLGTGEIVYACPKCAKDIEIFPDVTFENKFYTFIIKLFSATKDDNDFIKIISGYSDGTFRPEANITRAEVSKIISNTMKYGGFKNVSCDRYFCQDKFDESMLQPTLPDNIEIIKDFSVITGSSISDIDIQNSTLYVSDFGNGSIYSINQYGDNLGTIVDKLQSPESLTISDLNELLFIHNNSDQAVGKIDLTTMTVSYISGITLDKLGDVFELDAYTVGSNDYRLYGIRENNEVIQMNKDIEDYGLPTLRMDRSDLNKIQDFEIFEGKIYLVVQDQGIVCYYGSTRESFTISGLPTGISIDNVSSISIENGYIYLGDSIKNQIYELSINRDNSSLNFIAEYDLSKLNGDIIDLVSDSTNTSLYVVIGNKLVKMTL